MAEPVSENPCETVLDSRVPFHASAGTHDGGGSWDVDWGYARKVMESVKAARAAREEALRLWAEAFLDLQLEEWQSKALVIHMDAARLTRDTTAYFTYAVYDPMAPMKVVSGV